MTAATFKSSDYLLMIYGLAPEAVRCQGGELRAARLPKLRWLVQLGEVEAPAFLSFAALMQRTSARYRHDLAELTQ